MKAAKLLGLAMLMLCLAVPALASADSVKVKGNIQKDGYLTINFDWSVDTRDYPGKDRGQVKQMVHNEMYQAMLPKLQAKTQGMPVSYEKCNFTVLADNATLIKERPNGTKVYDVNTKVRFNAPYVEGTQATKLDAMGPEQRSNVRGNWQREFW